MAIDLALPTVASRTLARMARRPIAIVAYLGGLAILAVGAARALARPPAGAPPLGKALVRQWEWLFGAGLPLVGLIHVALGSFLSMQAYYGATFAEGVGPVVGVGLCRNLSPIMAGVVLAGLLASRATVELSRRPRLELDGDPAWVPDRDEPAGRESGPPSPTDPARLAAVRIAAAMVAGPVLAVWGSIVGILVGCFIAKNLVNVSTPIFFAKFLEMLWLRDIVGLAFKGALFGGAAALLACFEGLNAPADPRALPAAAARAACLSILAILFLNSNVYIAMYMSGLPFGPTVLTPPVP